MSRAVERRVLHVREPGFDYCNVPATGVAAETMAHTWMIWAKRCRTAVEAALPDSCAELYFNLGPTGRHLVSSEASHASSSFRAAWVLGPRANVVLLAKELADCSVVGVRLQPDVIPRLLGVPAAELRGRLIDLELLWGADVDVIRERLFETADPAERAALLEHEISRRALTPTNGDPALLRALRGAIEGWSDASVGRVADRFGLSHRRVIALFDEHIGLKPKEYQRVQRLRTVLSKIPAGGATRMPGRNPVSWAQVAHDVGDYDQAHLANEFRRLTGLTLTGYAASRSMVGDGFVPHRLGTVYSVCEVASASPGPPTHRHMRKSHSAPRA